MPTARKCPAGGQDVCLIFFIISHWPFGRWQGDVLHSLQLPFSSVVLMVLVVNDGKMLLLLPQQVISPSWIHPLFFWKLVPLDRVFEPCAQASADAILNAWVPSDLRFVDVVFFRNRLNSILLLSCKWWDSRRPHLCAYSFLLISCLSYPLQCMWRWTSLFHLLQIQRWSWSHHCRSH